MVFGGIRIQGAQTISKTDLQKGAESAAQKITSEVTADDALKTLTDVSGKLVRGKRLAIYDRSSTSAQMPRFARQFLISRDRAEHTVAVVRNLFSIAASKIDNAPLRQEVLGKLATYLDSDHKAIRGGELQELVRELTDAVNQPSAALSSQAPAPGPELQARQSLHPQQSLDLVDLANDEYAQAYLALDDGAPDKALPSELAPSRSSSALSQRLQEQIDQEQAFSAPLENLDPAADPLDVKPLIDEQVPGALGRPSFGESARSSSVVGQRPQERIDQASDFDAPLEQPARVSGGLDTESLIDDDAPNNFDRQSLRESARSGNNFDNQEWAGQIDDDAFQPDGFGRNSIDESMLNPRDSRVSQDWPDELRDNAFAPGDGSRTSFFEPGRGRSDSVDSRDPMQERDPFQPRAQLPGAPDMPEMREMPDSPQESPEPEPALKPQDPEARASFAQGRPSTQIDAGEPLANAPMDPDRQVDWNSFVGNVTLRWEDVGVMMQALNLQEPTQAPAVLERALAGDFGRLIQLIGERKMLLQDYDGRLEDVQKLSRSDRALQGYIESLGEQIGNFSAIFEDQQADNVEFAAELANDPEYRLGCESLAQTAEQIANDLEALWQAAQTTAPDTAVLDQRQNDYAATQLAGVNAELNRVASAVDNFAGSKASELVTAQSDLFAQFTAGSQSALTQIEQVRAEMRRLGNELQASLTQLQRLEQSLQEPLTNTQQDFGKDSAMSQRMEQSVAALRAQITTLRQEIQAPVSALAQALLLKAQGPGPQAASARPTGNAPVDAILSRQPRGLARDNPQQGFETLDNYLTELINEVSRAGASQPALSAEQWARIRHGLRPEGSLRQDLQGNYDLLRESLSQARDQKVQWAQRQHTQALQTWQGQMESLSQTRDAAQAAFDDRVTQHGEFRQLQQNVNELLSSLQRYRDLDDALKEPGADEGEARIALDRHLAQAPEQVQQTVEAGRQFVDDQVLTLEETVVTLEDSLRQIEDGEPQDLDNSDADLTGASAALRAMPFQALEEHANDLTEQTQALKAQPPQAPDFERIAAQDNAYLAELEISYAARLNDVEQLRERALRPA